MKKNIYQKPLIDFIKIDSADIIQTSTCDRFGCTSVIPQISDLGINVEPELLM